MAHHNYTKNKKVNEILREKIQQGWVLSRGKHLKLTNPKYPKGLITISSTPRCPFAHHKVEMDIRRVERGVY